MMSPDVQRSAIADYCVSRGYDIVDWLEGLDESGSRKKSAWWPRLEAATEQLEAGQFDVIVVWKFSRTARNRLRWAIALDRVETAGGRIESATEQVDATTSTGRFTRGMLAELNAFEAERIGEVWKEVHAKRLADGKAPQGTAKYGYVWNSDRQVHEPDPETAPILAEAYRRYVAGESFHSMVRWLNAAGHRTRNGGMWADTALRRVLDSGFAAGFIPWKGERYPGAHEPLISPDEWQAYLDSRATRRALPSRRERSQYVLSGLVRCSRCGGSMVANPANGKRLAALRCQTSKTMGPEVCAGGYVAMHVVVDEVLEWLREQAGDVDRAAAAVEESMALRVTTEGQMRRLTRDITKAQAQLKELTLLLVEKVITREAYASSRDELDERVARLEAEHRELGRRSRAVAMDPSESARGLLEGWRTWPVAHRREALGKLLDGILVRTDPSRTRAGVQNGSSGAVVWVVPSWLA